MTKTKFSEMTTTYWMIVERHPKPNEVPSGSIPGREIFSLLDGKTSLVVMHLLRSKKKRKKKGKKEGSIGRRTPIICVASRSGDHKKKKETSTYILTLTCDIDSLFPIHVRMDTGWNGVSIIQSSSAPSFGQFDCSAVPNDIRMGFDFCNCNVV